MNHQRIDLFLKLMHDRGASDLHLVVGRQPMLRVDGRLELIRYRQLDPSDYDMLLEPIVPRSAREVFDRDGDVDFAYEVPNLARFRVNLFRQQRGHGAVFRLIPSQVVTLGQLGLPTGVHKLAHLRHGLVLVTGPTGCGKSTTLASIIHEINQKRAIHIVTIEDPIEFVHSNQKAFVTQREIGAHSQNFGGALRAAVREDPDAILVGEMRDLETIETALRAAEAGFLVFGTLHTNSAAKTVDRIINVFPPERQEGIRGILAGVLKAVVAQQLVARKVGGQTAVVEVMLATPALSALIREGKTHQISGQISGGRALGMVSLEEALRRLFEGGVIEGRTMLEASQEKEEVRRWLVTRGERVPEDVAVQ